VSAPDDIADKCNEALNFYRRTKNICVTIELMFKLVKYYQGKGKTKEAADLLMDIFSLSLELTQSNQVSSFCLFICLGSHFSSLRL
jgi:hypothetical protein